MGVFKGKLKRWFYYKDEQDIALWYAVASILHGGSIDIFLVPANAPHSSLLDNNNFLILQIFSHPWNLSSVMNVFFSFSQ